MQMDAYSKKEQIGTLFAREGAPEGGTWGGGGRGPAQKSYVPLRAYTKFLFSGASCAFPKK